MSVTGRRIAPLLSGAFDTLEDAFAGPMGKSGGFSDGRDIGVVCNLPSSNGAAVLPINDQRCCIARARGQVSPLGIFMDLTADKVLVAGVLVAMVEVELLPTWMVALLLIRELVVQGVRQVAASSSVVQPVVAMIWGSAIVRPSSRRRATSWRGHAAAGSTPSPTVYESPSARKRFTQADLFLRGRLDLPSRGAPS